MYVDVSATMNLGGYAWGGQGFAVTHGMLPDSLCNPRLQSTQFSLGLVPKEDIPWDSDHPFALNPPTTFILQYSDQLVRDAFPDVPTTSGHAFNALLWTPFNAAWNIDAFLHLSAADQSAPVPEPGTIMLLGLGLAAAARARRKNKQK